MLTTVCYLQGAIKNGYTAILFLMTQNILWVQMIVDAYLGF